MKAGAALVAIALGVSGCAPWLASPEEYATFRKTRVAATLEGRLAAAHAYLERYPNGAFREPVKAYFDRAELVFFNAKQSSLPGLQDYVSTLPKGPHKDVAEARLEALKASRSSQDTVSSGVSVRLDMAEAERQEARKDLTDWIRRFLDAPLWKAPLSHAGAALIVPWVLAPPKPRCALLEAPGDHPGGRPGAPADDGAARRCTKLLELPYSVRVNGVNEPRQATVEIVVTEDRMGRPLSASIGGPDLFLRLEETYTIRAIEPGDGERRVASIARAVELVKGEFTRAISSDPACKRQVVAPVFLDLACQGVEVMARAGIAPGEDDVVVVRPQK